MNNGQRAIYTAAHLAAQSVAIDLSLDYLGDMSMDVSNPVFRKEVKRRLKEAGFAPFILEGDGLITLSPTSEGVIGDKESNTQWKLFDRSEYSFYVSWFNLDNHLNATTDVESNECRICGGYVNHFRRHDCMFCDSCGAEYTTEGMRMEHLVSELTGWNKFYSGPGRAFGETPSVKVTKSRILVKQYCGLDV